MRVRLPLLLCALLLGVLSAVAVACGDDDAGLLSAGRAERLHDDLDAIDQAVAAGRCSAVAGRLDSLRAEVEQLPRTTDERLVQRLREGVAHLQRQAPEECEGATMTETTPTTPETTPTTPETTPTTPQTTPTTETQPPAQTQPQQTQPTTPSTQPQPEPTTPSPTGPTEPDSGGAGGEEAPSGSGGASAGAQTE